MTLMSNAELAKLFFEVTMRTSLNPHVLVEQRRLIENYPVNIAEEFAKAETGGEVKISYLHKKHYRVLEAILRDGVERATASSMTRDAAWHRRWQFEGVPGSGDAKGKPPETTGSWENGVKDLES